MFECSACILHTYRYLRFGLRQRAERRGLSVYYQENMQEVAIVYLNTEVAREASEKRVCFGGRVKESRRVDESERKVNAQMQGIPFLQNKQSVNVGGDTLYIIRNLRIEQT
ncbi:hypothetical protein IMY05_016G0134500 [Salix suchowensis]|nr:hypothetical protein IMY05_016G0134500 [Salix suchowensis]